MSNKFEEVARWGANWLGHEAWQSHTVDENTAGQLVAGYVRFLDKIADINLRQGSAAGPAIDIGCGAGFIARAFNRRGISVSASEYDAPTVDFARSMQPDIEISQCDISTFLEPDRYGLIFTREVYLFTRVGDFEPQARILSNLIESLAPGGVLLLSASDRAKPACLDFPRAIAHFRKDARVASVTGCYLEPVFKHFGRFIFGPTSYRMIVLLLAPYIALQKIRGKWAPSLLVAFVRAK